MSTTKQIDPPAASEDAEIIELTEFSEIKAAQAKAADKP